MPELEHDLLVVPVSDFTAVLRAVEHLYLIKMQYLHYTPPRLCKVKVAERQGHHKGMAVAHQAQHRDLGKVKVVERQGHHKGMAVAHQAQLLLQYSR
jgi:hypothetical protein